MLDLSTLVYQAAAPVELTRIQGGPRILDISFKSPLSGRVSVDPGLFTRVLATGRVDLWSPEPGRSRSVCRARPTKRGLTMPTCLFRFSAGSFCTCVRAPGGCR